LGDKLDDAIGAMEPFNNVLDSIRNEVVTLGEREQHAEQGWVEARACYLDWRKQEDEQSRLSSRIRRTIVRRDYRSTFDEANGSLKKWTDELNIARSSFKDHLSQGSNSLAVHYQDIVEKIQKFTALFAEEQQSVASVLNAAGARLRHSMSTLSSSKLAGQFMEVLQDEGGSMKAEKALYCAWHQQDELRNFQHHQRLFGFRFSQDSCPGEAQLVVSLLKALLSKLRPNSIYMYWASDLLALEHKEREFEERWSIHSDDNQLLIQALDDEVCFHLVQRLLDSFPAPILSQAEVSRYSLESNLRGRLVGPSGNPYVDEMNLLAVASVHGRPQGEILQAIHRCVISFDLLFDEWYPFFCACLTREKEWLKAHFSILVRQYDDYVALLAKVSVVQG